MQTNEDAALTLLFTSDAAFADTAWNNKTFDGLVAKGRTELDPEKRKAIYAEAQQLMAKEKPSVLPMFQDVLTASRDVVQNWTCHPMSKNFYVEDVWLKRA
jgi:peptide/nickel transport system substrate-binding protein